MQPLPAPDLTQELFHVDIVPDEGPVQRELGKGEPPVKLTCGMPVASDLFAQYADWGEQAPLAVRQQRDRFDFWLVQMAFTLDMRPGYHVPFLQIGVTLDQTIFVPERGRIHPRLKPGLRPDGETHARPIAYNLYPIRVVDVADEEDKVAINPSLEFAEFKFSLIEAGLTLKYKIPQPRVTGFGKGLPEPYWEFRPGTNDWVEPGIKELALVVRSDRQAPTRAKVWIKGTGQHFIFRNEMAQPEDSTFYF
jgi:hypothetical protein